MDRIERTKYELIDSLSQDGVAIFNADDERCRAMADRTRHVRVLRYAIDHANRDVGARDIHHGPDGLSFVIEDRSGDSATVRTRVLGRHNVLNILGASCVAMEFGIKCQDIARFAGRLRPAPHRLELIHGSGGLVILDDSYNSNPIGAKGALEVLGEFKDGNRILVTPGMVELGTEEERLNQEFGEMAAGVCSRVILVGKARTTPILNGLRRQGFSEADTSVVESLGEARAELARVGQPGDVVLLENDLPDLYNE